MAKRRISSLMMSASVWTLVQSVINLIVASLGIAVHRCGLLMTGNQVQYTLYVLYFYSSSCSNTIDLGLLAPSSQGMAILMTTPFTAERTLRWMTIHLVIACLWIITSVLMIVGSLNRVSGGYSLLFCGPWLVCASLAIFSDAIASITYITDIPQVTEASTLLHFIGATFIPANVADGVSTWSAPAILASYFARGFVFWVTNVFFLVAVITESRRMATLSKKQPQTNDNQQVALNNTTIVNPTREWLNSNTRYNDITLRASNQTYPDKQLVDDGKWRVASTATANNVKNESSTSKNPTRLKPTLSQRQNDLTRDNSITSSPKRSESMIVEDKPTGKTSSMPKISGNEAKYPYRSSDMDNVREVYEKPSLNYMVHNRVNDENSKNYANYVEKPIEKKQAACTTVAAAPMELRGQLPWSYLQEATPISVVSHGMRGQLPEDEYLPPVPVPDYTLHFPHRKRREGIHRESSSASNHSEPRSPKSPLEGIPNGNRQGKKWGEVLY